MNKNTKKSVAFFLVVLCGVSLLNCMPKEKPISKEDQEAIARAEIRYKAFQERRAEYIREHGHVPPHEMQNGYSLIQK